MKIVTTSILMIVILFSGCKKKEGPAGPAGPQGPQGPVLTLNNGGNITGTLTGTRQDGTPFTEPFSYTYYFSGDSGQLDSLATNFYVFSLQRSVNDIFSNNSCGLSVSVTSKTASSGTLDVNYFTFEKSLGANKMFYFSVTSSAVTAPATVLSYNSSTGLFSGNFTCNILGSQNTSGNPATITGNFQATVTQMFYRTQQAATIKTD